MIHEFIVGPHEYQCACGQWSYYSTANKRPFFTAFHWSSSESYSRALVAWEEHLKRNPQ